MKTSLATSTLLACTAAALLQAVTPTSAQDADAGTVALDQIEIVAKSRKAAAPGSDTPLATQTTAEDIAKQEIDSIEDLGNTTEPGVDYSKRTDGVVIRGLSGPRVATIIDGIPIPYLENLARGGGPTGSITNADGGGSSFDFASLSALDVLKGADSSRIGSGALGGGLVLRTLEPEDLIADGRSWGGLTKLIYDSEDNSFSGSLAVAGRVGGTSALLQGSYKKGDETQSNGSDGSYGRSRTEANPADLDQNNILFKVRQDIEGGHQIGITAERFERQKDTGLASDWNLLLGTAPRPGMPDNRYTYDPYGYFGHDDVLRERVSLDYRFEAPEADARIEAAFAKIYWQRLTKNAGASGAQIRQRDGGLTNYLRDNELQESDIGFTGGATGGFMTGTLDHQWTVGLDVQRLEASGYTLVVPSNPASGSQPDLPDVEGTRIGAFMDDRIAFGDGRFALTPGIRFDWFHYSPKPSARYLQNPGAGIFDFDDKTDFSFSPKLLATYDVTPDVRLFAQWAAAFRAPTVNELYLNFTNPSTGYAQVGNPDLKSETGYGFEIGAEVDTADFGGRVAVFHNRYRNFIVETPLTPDPAYPMLPFGVGSYENLDRVEISGIELKAHKIFDNGIRVHGALSYVYGKDMVANTQLRSVAPFKAIAGIGYVAESWGVDVQGIFAAGMHDDRDPATFDAPSYAIANLTGWWEPTQVKGLRIQAGVYNVFDSTYYDALGVRNVDLTSASSQPRAFYSEPGRTFKLSLTQRF